MIDEELSDDWPGTPVRISGVIKMLDGTVYATIDGVAVDPTQLPDLLAKLEGETDA